MTVINIHGILGKEFGETMSMLINRPKEILEAIDANKRNFKSRLTQLALEGVHYTILIDGKSIKKMEEMDIKKRPTTVDLVPIICGHGAIAAAVIAVGAFAAAATGVTLGIGITMATWVSIGVMALGMAVQMAMAPKPEMDRTESTISGAKQSFMMSNKGNLIEQGSPVPVGYGRLRIGSRVIQTTIKSYPQRHSVENALVGKNKATSADASFKEIK